MNNFQYQNPTRILFGRGEAANLGQEIPAGNKVLVTYGGGSVKANGILDDVRAALQAHTVFEFGGIEPNPKFETLIHAVAFAQEKGIDFILAVGGGSVIDGSKFIAAAACFEGDPKDILLKQAPVSRALPLGCVLTLAATGSESNAVAVITIDETKDKLAMKTPLAQPVFAVLDPAYTFTLPREQTCNGVVDAFVHVLEQYLTYDVNAPLQDRLAEGILLTLLEEAPRVLDTPRDYDVRANLMWCATLALNGLIGQGVPQDWSTHLVGHELTALFGLDHAHTLGVLLPRMLRERKARKHDKLLKYAERVWNLDTGTEDEKIDFAIAKTEAFFQRMGIKTRLREYGIHDEDIPRIVANLERHGMLKMGERQEVGIETAQRVLYASV